MKIQPKTKKFQIDNDVEREREEKEFSNQFITKPKELVRLDGAEPKEEHGIEKEKRLIKKNKVEVEQNRNFIAFSTLGKNLEEYLDVNPE
ncbi:unnamed protein product [Dovyalis caffra]|uniref:Uncharacterized protein n=1 Tax=Dovyalis caffra TaxID=77055 RepID=A0AAV1SP07_9ROSI|nr:unnamed protein product [Dovyalis caffra]